MAKKKKKKPPPDAKDPKGKMRPAEGAPGRPDDEGTRIDDGARHVFFSFKGELKDDLPADATQTDLAGNLGLPGAEDTGTSDDADESAAESQADEPADEATAEPAPAPPDTGAAVRAEAKPPEVVDAADVTFDDPVEASSAEVRASEDAAETAFEDDDTTATGEEDAAHRKHEDADAVRAEEQHRAGPVQGPDPAAEKNASQSRKAAGPAHITPPAEAPRGASAAEPKPPAPASEEPPTRTDVRGEPFAALDATRTEVDKLIFSKPKPAADAKKPEAPKAAQPPAPAKPAPRKLTTVGDEAAVGSETMLDASVVRPKRKDDAKAPVVDVTRSKPKDETAAGSETVLDAVVRKPERPAEETAAGSQTVLDVEGVRGQEDPAATMSALDPAATRSADDAGATRFLEPEPTRDDAAATRTGPDATTASAPEIAAGTEPPKPRGYAGPDADTVTKEPPPTSTEARITATDVSRAPAPEAPSFHEAETASQLDAIAGEAALPPPAALDEQLDGSTTEPFAEAAPAPFAGALFDAPAAAAAAPAVEPRPEAPRLRRRRRSERPKKEPLLQRIVHWAKHNLDPRDFLEIAGKAAFERAQKVGERMRTARRENRVAHTAAWWRQTLLELAILWAIVIPIELAVSGGRLGSFGVHPHPYWLVVLPLAIARGLVAGLIAAGVAAALYAVGAAQAVSSDLVWTFRNMTEPLLFFAVAFFAGEMHDEGLLRRKKLSRRIKDLEERTEQLRQQRDVLTDANRELEKRIVDDSVQFGNLIQAARRIERAGRQEIFDLALQMAEEHCGAAASVLILLEDQSIDYLCHRGWSSEEIGKRLALARGSPFVKRAVAEGVPVNGIDPTEVAPPEGPLVVAPLFDAGGVVKAIMCLDEIPLARLNESTVTVFLGIADWASAALGRLTRGGDTPAARQTAMSVGPEVDIWLGNVADLGRRLRIELARCSRYGVATSFLTIHATEWKDATREGIDALDRFVLMHFTTGLRPSDSVYRFGYPGAYLLVLAGTGLKGAEVVKGRLERRISYTPSQVGAIEIRATGPDTEAPDLASLVARVAKGFRERSKLALDARCPVSIPERIEAEDLNAFLRRLKMETSLAVRNGFDLHVVGISAEASESAGPGILARHVVEVGEQTLRPTDGVYMIGQYQCAVILPSTNGEEAATVAHRLATLVRARDPSAPYGQIETQVLGLGATHPDAGSFLTALARRAREGAR